jgi:hypothetical protein
MVTTSYGTFGPYNFTVGGASGGGACGSTPFGVCANNPAGTATTSSPQFQQSATPSLAGPIYGALAQQQNTINDTWTLGSPSHIPLNTTYTFSGPSGVSTGESPYNAVHGDNDLFMGAMGKQVYSVYGDCVGVGDCITWATYWACTASDYFGSDQGCQGVYSDGGQGPDAAFNLWARTAATP